MNYVPGSVMFSMIMFLTSASLAIRMGFFQGQYKYTFLMLLTKLKSKTIYDLPTLFFDKT